MRESSVSIVRPMPPVYDAVFSTARQPIAVGVRYSVIGWCCQKSLTASVIGPSPRTPSWRAPGPSSKARPPAGAMRSVPAIAISSPPPVAFSRTTEFLPSVKRPSAMLPLRWSPRTVCVPPAPSTIS